jgi:hypothetical protein
MAMVVGNSGRIEAISSLVNPRDTSSCTSCLISSTDTPNTEGAEVRYKGLSFFFKPTSSTK